MSEHGRAVAAVHEQACVQPIAIFKAYRNRLVSEGATNSLVIETRAATRDARPGTALSGGARPALR